MVDRARLVGCLLGSVLAFVVASWWYNVRLATWCAKHLLDPCRAPADFGILIVALVTLLGAVLGAVIVAVAQRRTRGSRKR